ncbi:hypothetical protein CR105_26445 [Massilia eurypsychrophila]|uniref:Uncharacterized protein n=1 Tax=Massilia eurypsychrophila TaxID=1485217 RepID=A0A2G8T8P7_9BURK|nr:hypothetical protein [Massilia eurypsychrophila]PIL42038.1 hypothetical protein CR105_26445 [Massilia eurypsychrophila]
MKIQMTRTIQGSLDGVTVKELVGGLQYETVEGARGDRLARYHIGKGDAILAPAAIEPLAPQPDAPLISLARPKKSK